MVQVQNGVRELKWWPDTEFQVERRKQNLRYDMSGFPEAEQS